MGAQKLGLFLSRWFSYKLGKPSNINTLAEMAINFNERANDMNMCSSRVPIRPQSLGAKMRFGKVYIA